METYSFYLINCKDENIIDNYIGSTSNLKDRLKHHLKLFNNENHKGYYRKIYKIIRDNGGFENWKMEELFTFECNNNIEARKIEQKLIDEYQPTLNTYRAYTDEETRKKRHAETTEIWRQLNLEHKRDYEYYKYNTDETWRQRKIESSKTYYENHIEEKKIYRKEFYKNNKQKCLDKSKVYRDANRDEINRKQRETPKLNNSIKCKEYYKTHIEEQKAYRKSVYEKNKDKILIERALYREKNKDEINRKQRENHHRKKEQKLMCLEDKV